MAKKFFIKSSSDLITRELERLQTKVSFLEASTSDRGARRPRRTAVFSPPVEADTKRVEIEFEDDEEMFTAPKKPDSY